MKKRGFSGGGHLIGKIDSTLFLTQKMWKISKNAHFFTSNTFFSKKSEFFELTAQLLAKVLPLNQHVRWTSFSVWDPCLWTGWTLHRTMYATYTSKKPCQANTLPNKWRKSHSFGYLFELEKHPFWDRFYPSLGGPAGKKSYRDSQRFFLGPKSEKVHLPY
jgi:hypothetical protein